MILRKRDDENFVGSQNRVESTILCSSCHKSYPARSCRCRSRPLRCDSVDTDGTKQKAEKWRDQGHRHFVYRMLDTQPFAVRTKQPESAARLSSTKHTHLYKMAQKSTVQAAETGLPLNDISGDMSSFKASTIQSSAQHATKDIYRITSPEVCNNIDCTAALRLDTIRDIFLTYQGSVGFYLFKTRCMHVIFEKDQDIELASSSFPSNFRGLQVSCIHKTMQPTMISDTQTEEVASERQPLLSKLSRTASWFQARQDRKNDTKAQSQLNGFTIPQLQLNGFIEARAKRNQSRARHMGRIGLQLIDRYGERYLTMSTHVITEAILATQRTSIFGRFSRDRDTDQDWNAVVEILAGDIIVRELVKDETRCCELKILTDWRPRQEI